MGIKFATDEWGKALMDAVNSSEAYARAAAVRSTGDRGTTRRREARPAAGQS